MDKCFCHLNGFKVKDADARKQLEGKASMGDIRVSGIKSKNLFKPTLVADDGTLIAVGNGTAVLNNDKFIFTATTNDLYFGQIGSVGEYYNRISGNLIDVSNYDSITYTLSNNLFDNNYVTYYDENLICLKVTKYSNYQDTLNLLNAPIGTKYVSFRFGLNTATVGETYETTIQLEVGNVATEYVPYFEIGTGIGNGGTTTVIENAKGFYHISLPLGNIEIGNLPNDNERIDTYIPVACLNKLGELINKIIEDGIKQPIVVIENTSDVTQGKTFLFNVMSVYHGEDNTTMYGFQGAIDDVRSLSKGKETTYDASALLSINGEMENGKFVIYEGENTSVLSCVSYSCLTLFNEIEYTPTGDYNPATKKYVDDAVANAGAGEGVDLTDYATKVYVDESIANIGSGDTNDCGIIKFDHSLPTVVGNSSTISDTEIRDKILNGILSNKEYPPSFLINSGANSCGTVLFNFYNASTQNLYKEYYYYGAHIVPGTKNANKIYKLTIQVKGLGYKDDDILINLCSISFYSENTSLNIDNTSTYEPTNPYHPATKKYVDDSINATIVSDTSEQLTGDITIMNGRTGTVNFRRYRHTYYIDGNIDTPNLEYDSIGVVEIPSEYLPLNNEGDCELVVFATTNNMESIVAEVSYSTGLASGIITFKIPNYQNTTNVKFSASWVR